MEGAAHSGMFTISARLYNKEVRHVFMSISETMTMKEIKEKIVEEFNIDKEKEIRIIVCGEYIDDNETCKGWSSITCPHIIVVQD